MNRRRLYLLLQPESPGPGARIFRAAHHLMVAAGIAIMLTATVTAMADAHGSFLEIGFYVVAAFFLVEYVLRLIAAPEAPGGEHRRPLDARLGWATSLGGGAVGRSPIGPQAQSVASEARNRENRRRVRNMS